MSTSAKRYLLTLGFGMLCLGGWIIPTPNRAAGVTVAELANATDHFDESEVVLRGTAADVELHMSKRGNLYTTLKLEDRGGSVPVFTFGRPSVESGDPIEVRGVFRKVKEVGRYTFHNEVEAWSITRAADRSRSTTSAASPVASAVDRDSAADRRPNR
ncbi:MAG TPA: hypothetical protein VMT89_18830 [Candidatus Acidoferrales bacterium]|nr:hypothetical protein [Candidatus Acidoferrales bacterium]